MASLCAILMTPWALVQIHSLSWVVGAILPSQYVCVCVGIIVLCACLIMNWFPGRQWRRPSGVWAGRCVVVGGGLQLGRLHGLSVGGEHLPGRVEVKLSELLRQLHGLGHHALQLVVVAHLRRPKRRESGTDNNTRLVKGCVARSHRSTSVNQTADTNKRSVAMAWD